MSHELCEYLKSELTAWSRLVAFHKDELKNLVPHLAVVIEDKGSPVGSANVEASSYLDQFMVQGQQWSHLAGKIAEQALRLEKTDLLQLIDDTIFKQQDVLRSQMNVNERNTMRAKHNCSVFLFELLENKWSKGNGTKAKS